MKRIQLLSIVFSLTMFAGVTTGNAVFAESDDAIDSFEDCVEAGYPIMESFPEQCRTDDGTVFVNYDNDRHGLDDRLEKFCEMTDEEKRQLFADHPRLEQFAERLLNYCEISEEEREDAIDKFIAEHFPREHDFDLDDLLDKFCEMTDEEKRQLFADHPRLAEFSDRLANYCEMSEEEQDAIDELIEEHEDKIKNELRVYMKDKMTDKKHMNYDRLCEMTESDRAAEIDDSEKLDRISDWCEMTPEEREDYKREHHDNKMHDFDGMSDKAKHHMSDVAKTKLSDNSERLKAMIMDKRDISDEKHDEIRMKFESKWGEEADEKRSEIKMEYKKHMLKMKFKMSDERKSDVHDRVYEMKAFKADLRERSSELTDEEKQQLREEFIEKAKDMQLAWISPRTQMTAGIDAAEVECREGYNLVMKASNGVAMCLKADSALKMIDRGIVVPAN